MGICFVGEKRSFNQFLGMTMLESFISYFYLPPIADYLPPKPGPIIDSVTGHTIGEHQGLWTYTIGQGAKIRGMQEKLFVARKDKEQNAIFVVPSRYGFETSHCHSDTLTE